MFSAVPVVTSVSPQRPGKYKGERPLTSVRHVQVVDCFGWRMRVVVLVVLPRFLSPFLYTWSPQMLSWRSVPSHIDPLHIDSIAPSAGLAKVSQDIVIQMNRIRGLPSIKEDELSILGYLGLVPHPDITMNAHFAIGRTVPR